MGNVNGEAASMPLWEIRILPIPALSALRIEGAIIRVLAIDVVSLTGNQPCGARHELEQVLPFAVVHLLQAPDEVLLLFLINVKLHLALHCLPTDLL